ncbi:fimbria/pilus chaperone family protein [Obesumbacterium proteus]|uniref:fimbria/pilus chaperone family protein n=1 Tax=Obesumbacterium proteus TaxID=82983 RepID=UPI00242A65C1|nr:fimbria/pilus chaperone family protein [Obesumbacterium proteus]
MNVIKQNYLKNSILLSFLIITPALFISNANASGMKLETSVVVVNTADGEGVMTLKNTDAKPVLLYSSVENLPGDKEESLVVTPPVVRVNPGDNQTVRFMLKTPPKAVEQFKRAIFEGIPAADKTSDKLQITIRQNVPLIIHPSSLKDNPEPWKLLQFKQTGPDTVSVTNAGAYVIRMNPGIEVLPQGVKGSLPRAYILPGDSFTVKLSGAATGGQKVKITPANLYGYFVKPYEAALNR